MGRRGLSDQGETETSVDCSISKNGDARIAYTVLPILLSNPRSRLGQSLLHSGSVEGGGGLFFNSVLVYSHMMCTEYH